MKHIRTLASTLLVGTMLAAGGAQAKTLVYCSEGSPEGFDPAPYTYGLVMLGYSLKRAGGREALGSTLLGLVDHARIVVIEWALQLERAAHQVPHLLSRPGLRQLCRIDFTLEDGTIEHSPYGQRRLVVLEPAIRGGER